MLLDSACRVFCFCKYSCRPRFLRDELAGGERPFGPILSHRDYSAANVASGPDPRTRGQRADVARKRGPLPRAGDGKRRNGVAGERVGGGFLCQPKLARAYWTERERDARVWLAAGCPSRRPAARQTVMGARND